MAISSNGTVLARLAGGLYNQTLSNATYTEVVSSVKTAADINTFANDLYVRDFGSKTDLQVATTLLSNLGLSSITGLDNWVSAQLTAAGAGNKGAKIVSLLNDLANLTSDATYGSYATAFNTKTAAALALSQTANSAGGDFNAAAAIAAAAAAAAAEAAAAAAAAAAANAASAAAALLLPKEVTLTTDVASYTGGAGSDTFFANQATASTYLAGDSIYGGEGADRLNITLRADPDDTPAVILGGVETVVANVQATDATGGALDASLWSGVTTLSNAGSTGGSLLSVSGLELSTVVRASGNTDVTLAYRGDLSGSTDSVSVILDKFGSGTGTTLALTGELTVDSVESVSIDLVGTSFLSLEGGASLKTVNLSGTGAVTFLTNDTGITRVDASSLVGTNSFAFSGLSTLTATGGAGADTFTFYTGGLTNADTVAGGEGVDTIRAVFGLSTAAPALSGFETGRFTFTEVQGNLDLSSNTSGFSKITVSGSATTDINLTNVYADAAGLTVVVDDAAVRNLSIDTNSSSTTTIQLGSATGNADIGTLEINDISTLTLSAVSNSGTETVTLLDADSDLKNATINAGGSGEFTIGSADFSAIETLTLKASGSATLTLTSADLTSTAITTLTINAEGSDAADVVLNGNLFSGASAGMNLTTLTINATTGADVDLDGLTLGTATMTAAEAHTVAISIVAGASSLVSDAGSGIDVTMTGTPVTLSLEAQASGNILIDAIAGGPAGGANGGTALGSLSLSVNVGVDGYAEVESIAASALPVNFTSLTIAENGDFEFGSGGVAVQGGSINLGTVTVGTGASASFGIGGSGLVASALGAITVDLATGASAAFGNVSASASLGAVTLTVATGAAVDFGTIAISGTMGQFNATLASNAELTVGNISADKSIAGISVAVGSGASADFGNINASSIGAISLTAASGASADVGTIQASGVLTSFSISGNGVFDVADLKAVGSGTIGSIDVALTTGDASATFAAVGTADAAIGSITVNLVTGADVTFTDLEATALSTLTVIGGGTTNITFSGDKVTTIDLSGQNSSAVTNLTLGASAGSTVVGGLGTNTLTLGSGADTVALYTGGGTDTLRYTTASDGTDTITGFTTGTDVLNFASAAFGASGYLRDADGATVTTADLSVLISAATTLNTSDSVIMLATAFDSNASALDFLDSNITFTTALAGEGSFLVVYSTGTDSVVASLRLGTATSLSTLASGSANLTLTQVAVISGVTPGALVAADFTVS